MERKEMIMAGKKQSSVDHEFSGTKNAAAAAASFPRTREEGRISSASELFESLSQGLRNRGQHDARRALTSSEFLDFLRKQGPQEHYFPSSAGRSMRADGNSDKSQNMHMTKEYRNQDYQSTAAAIDQCDITSSVDYGCRDYYQISKHTSDVTPYVPKENELDNLYEADTRGNWWQGSLYY